ncbi:MAG: hypothetical protein WC719_02455 [Patescibacteria group bacterium]|jgi:hypothetical protein
MLFDIIHSFVNIFAGGRSEIKTILFILYLLFLITLYLSLRGRSFKALKWKWFGLSLLIMYLYGLGLHIFHVLANKLPLTTFFVTGRNGEISCSSLQHTHIAKAAIAQIFSYFDKIKFPMTDAGGAYLGIIPGWILLFGSLLLIILLLQAVLYFTTSFKKLLDDKSTRQKAFLIFGYALISFSLIKTSLDGGAFDRGSIISLIFVIIFILREKKAPLAYYYYIIGPIIGAFFLAINFFSLGGRGTIAALAALILLYTLVLYGSEKKIKSWILFLLFLFFMASWQAFGIGNREIRDYSSIMLPAGSEAYFYDEQSQETKILITKQPQSIRQLAKSLRKNVSYLPIGAPGINCTKSKPRPKFSITLITKEPLAKNALAATENIMIINGTSSGYGERWQTDMRILLNPCLLETVTILNGELTKNGLNDYLLINPIFYGSSNIY